jgi:hypothetical protein
VCPVSASVYARLAIPRVHTDARAAICPCASLCVCVCLSRSTHIRVLIFGTAPLTEAVYSIDGTTELPLTRVTPGT